MTMDQIDKTFCQVYRLPADGIPTQREEVTNFTLHTYYRILNGALNAAVRAEIIKVNPFTKLNNSNKIRLPESKRSYMTIEEVKALITTPMKKEAVKNAYLFLLLRAARRRYCGAEVEGRVHRPGAIPFGRVHAEDERADLSAAFSGSVEVGAGTGKQDGGGSCVRLAKSDTYESADKTVGESGGDRQAVYFSYGKAYVYDDDADTPRRIYTTSKLLGHADVKMTQVYAKIINQKKDDR